MRPQVRNILLGGLVLAFALTALGWIDYRAVSRELRDALRAEARALHATIAAAARAQQAAAAQAEAALTQRLLENARLLAALDKQGGLGPETLELLVGDNDLFRIMVFDVDGRRVSVAGDTPGQHGAPYGSGRGGLGRGGSPGYGRAAGGGRPVPGAGPPEGVARLAQRLLAGEAEELVSGPHTGPGGHERIAAGVRRPRGGAIVLNAANRAAEELEQAYSLDPLLAEIAAETPRLAYVALEGGDRQIAHGPDADQGSAEGTVLEERGVVSLADGRTAQLRVAMRLDDVRRAEQRTIARLSIGVSSVAALTVLALAFGSLRERYGRLSDRHAQAEAALRQRDRLAAMGEMASTVAHEIRNPLNAIAMSAQRLAREHGDEGDASELQGLVTVIQQESARIDATVQQFLEFARPRALNLQSVPLGAWADQIVAAARPTAAAHDISLDAGARIDATIQADPDQLREAVDHLVRNAIEATPPGGRVTVSTAYRNGAFAIDVQDTGAGIPSDVLPRIFDLYFTTKREGTGIGLAVAHQVVTAHGGSIIAASEPHGGTRMTIHLPGTARNAEGRRS